MKFQRKLGLMFLVGFFVAVFSWFYLSQKNFQSLVVEVAKSPIEYFQLCDILNEASSTSCITIDAKTGGEKFIELKKTLAEAQLIVPPGKVATNSSRVMKIKLSTSVGGEYQKCYLLTEYKGFDGIYLNDFSSDSQCSRVVEYRAGYVLIRRIDALMK
jgi:hypothetical protein